MTSTAGLRPPDSARRISTLDGMRALAAFGVIATHAGFNSGRSLGQSAAAPFLARLDFGVTVFFLLSGFLLYQPFVGAALGVDPRPRVARFYLRRALRILPAYWISVLVTLLWISPRPADGGDVLSYTLLIQTYNHHNLDPSLTQMWTLVVEVTFYALLPVLALAARSRNPERAVRRQVALLAGLVSVAVAADVVGHANPPRGIDSLIWLPANIDWFALGMALALVATLMRSESTPGRFTQSVREIANAPVTCWVVGALLFWIATLPVAGPRDLTLPTAWEWTIKHWLYGLAATPLLIPLVAGDGGILHRVLASRPMRVLGDLSYGIYLWHLPLLLAIQRGLGYHTFGGHFWVLFLTTSVAATAVAAVSWYGLERHLLRLGRWRAPVPAKGTVTASATLSQQSA
jgi:peptidoglycan/LPS O-acetylase OafA/YrhL